MQFRFVDISILCTNVVLNCISNYSHSHCIVVLTVIGFIKSFTGDGFWVVYLYKCKEALFRVSHFVICFVNRREVSTENIVEIPIA